MAVAAMQFWSEGLLTMPLEERLKSIALGELLTTLCVVGRNKAELDAAIKAELEVEAQAAYGEWS